VTQEKMQFERANASSANWKILWSSEDYGGPNLFSHASTDIKYFSCHERLMF